MTSGPPPAPYVCTVGAYQQVSGTLRVYAHHRYRFRHGRIGHFSVHGRKVTFLTGGWHGRFSGRYYRASGTWEIQAKPLHGGLTRFCDKR